MKAAVKFYEDVFNLKKLKRGEGDAFFQLGEHQFLAIFEVEKLQPDRTRHFGIMVRDKEQVNEVRKKVTEKYGLKLTPPFRCDFVIRGATGFRWSISTMNRSSGSCLIAKCRRPA